MYMFWRLYKIFINYNFCVFRQGVIIILNIHLAAAHTYHTLFFEHIKGYQKNQTPPIFLIFYDTGRWPFLKTFVKMPSLRTK